MNFSSGSIALGEFRLSARQGGVAGALVLLVFLGWGAAYATGIYPWTGRESGTVRSFGAGKITVIGNQKRVNSMGFKRFYYWAGQEAMLHYSADVRAGGLRIYLAHGGGLRQRVSDTWTISESGSGEFTFVVPQSGFYRWSINPTVTRGGKGYDLSYTASWGARPAR